MTVQCLSLLHVVRCLYFVKQTNKQNQQNKIRLTKNAEFELTVCTCTCTYSIYAGLHTCRCEEYQAGVTGNTTHFG